LSDINWFGPLVGCNSPWIKWKHHHNEERQTVLEEITIENLGIISHARLPFTPGLTVLTGETGAGKTMVLSAINLLLGKRINASNVTVEGKQLSVEGCWQLDDDLSHTVEDTGASLENGQLFVQRVVSNDGKSKAYMGGKRMTASTLNSIGNQLVSIHGQSEQVRLRDPQLQRESLDAFGGTELHQTLQKFQSAYTSWKEVNKFYNDVKDNANSRRREITYLEKLIQDVSQLDPQENEDEILQHQINKLSNLETVRESLLKAQECIAPSDDEILSPVTQIRELQRVLTPILNYDAKWAELHEHAREIITQLFELENEISTHVDSMDEDSLEQLYTAQERAQEIKTLVRKYGTSLADVLQQADEAHNQLEHLYQQDVPLEDIEVELETCRKSMIEAANQLTEQRVKTADLLSEAINVELAGLGMSNSVFSIVINPADTTFSGQDEVLFMLAHQGHSPAPITRIASGGELSRIMLAMELVLAKGHGTLIFDEVDSGVGGETAVGIGKRLARLAQDVQVIVVTHLPQVAAYADNHLKVYKEVNNEQVQTYVKQLPADERITEITRMLSGMADSSSGQLHASELLNMAQEYKNILMTNP
jgi:DNA repair protein RecN (Recombination protein N)